MLLIVVTNFFSLQTWVGKNFTDIPAKMPAHYTALSKRAEAHRLLDK
jgi:hypothetical protein